MENTNEKVVDTQDFAGEGTTPKGNNATKELLSGKPKRNAGIDLMRILSMLMVVMLHVFGHDNYSRSQEFLTLGWGLSSIFGCLIIVAVNCFGLLAGYVNSGKKYNVKNIINLWLQVVFVCLVSSLVFYFVKPGTVSIKNIIFSFLPVYSKQYWYFSAYFLLFFFIPLLNVIIEKTDKKLLISVLCVLAILIGVVASLSGQDIFVLANGYSTIWLMYLYLVGGVVKKYGLCIKIKGKPVKTYVYLLLYFASSILNFIVSTVYLLVLKAQEQAGFGNYNFILNLMGAIFILLFFANVKMKSNKFITMLSLTSFGVYVIHSQKFISERFIQGKFTFLQTLNPFVAILTIIGISIAIYIICTAIEYLRQLLFKLVGIPKFTAWCQQKIENVYHKIGNKKESNPTDK